MCGGSAGQPAEHGNELAGTYWTLTELAGAPPLAGTVITLDFAASCLTEQSGCNYYSGTCTVTGAGTLTIGELAQTAMACAGPAGIMEQERRYLDALGDAATYSLVAGLLSLATTADRALVFTART